MVKPTNDEVRPRVPLVLCIVIVLILYILQGVAVGLVGVLPIYLVSFNATWKEQGTFSFVMYPFSLKLLWAPLIDVFYIRRWGRRQTWLLPIQVLIGITLITISFYLESLLIHLRVTILTVIFFFVIFLIATQDICVDGWALTLFTSSNVVWQSISQVIGQPLGAFFGSSILLTFESANQTNRFIRQPFGMPAQSYGLFTLPQFVRFWGVAFLVVACIVSIFFREPKHDTNNNEKENVQTRITLRESYWYIARLFKKKCFRQFLTVLVCPPIGYTATSSMTYLTLIGGGLISRETLGLVTMPLILVKITVPLLLARTRQPLIFFARLYVPRLIVCVLIAIFVFFHSSLASHPSIFYFLLVTLFGLNDAFVYMQGAARGGFFAQISDPRIGGTYYTLLASLNNAGQVIATSLVFYTATWLPKDQAYYIEVGVCLLLGGFWLCTSWKLMHKLQLLPIGRWHVVTRTKSANGDDHHPLSTIVQREAGLSTVAGDTECSCRF